MAFVESVPTPQTGYVMPHHLFIAEKPSLAEAIAAARGEQLGAKPVKTDGCWEVGPDRVTWFFGHMYEMAEPKVYDERWKSWTIESLPIVVRDGQWKLVPHDDKKAHIKKVAGFVKKAEIIVNCGDPAREGQLLVDEALIEMGVNPFNDSTLRLWVQSMARRDMIAALSSMQPNQNKRSLYDAAVCRQRADWQHGMTFSRLYTLLARNSGSDVKISVGRVQTPTLRLVVDRDRERIHFKPVDHFLVHMLFRHHNGDFKAVWVAPPDHEGLDQEGRLIDGAVAEKIIAACKSRHGVVKSFSSEVKSKPPPLPYSLSALQSEVGAKLGLTAKQVLDIAQSLYEKHRATTYPRTDSRYLPTTILKDEAKAIMANLGRVESFSEAVSNADMNLKSAAWNDSKVSDHHGLIPTTEFSSSKLAGMSDIERKVFSLIALSFISQFYPNQRWRATVADISCQSMNFKANGRQVVDQGWRRVFGVETADEDEDGDSQALPDMKTNDGVEALNGSALSKRTTPPPAFTDPTLIAAMANIHRFVSNPEIKKRLKESDGIGTEATRAECIETLIRRGFIIRKGKNGLESSEVGRSIIDSLPEDLKDPGLTAAWESALQRVEAKTISPDDFLLAQVKDIERRVMNGRSEKFSVKGAKKLATIDGHGEACPKCGKGTLLTREIQQGQHKGKKYLSCSLYPECDYRAWPTEKVDPLPGHGKECPSCHQGKLITRAGISKKDGKRYVFLSCSSYPDCKHAEWPESNIEKLPGDGKPCPKCGTAMKTFVTKKDGPNKGKRFLACSNRDCKTFEFPDELNGKELAGHGGKCEKCKKGVMMTRSLKGRDGSQDTVLACNNYPECKNIVRPQGSNKENPGGKTSIARARRPGAARAV